MKATNPNVKSCSWGCFTSVFASLTTFIPSNLFVLLTILTSSNWFSDKCKIEGHQKTPTIGSSDGCPSRRKTIPEGRSVWNQPASHSARGLCVCWDTPLTCILATGNCLHLHFILLTIFWADNSLGLHWIKQYVQTKGVVGPEYSLWSDIIWRDVCSSLLDSFTTLCLFPHSEL